MWVVVDDRLVAVCPTRAHSAPLKAVLVLLHAPQLLATPATELALLSAAEPLLLKWKG